MDLRTGILEKITPPPHMIYGGFKLSPNGEHLAFWKSNLDADGKSVDLWLVVENADGKVMVEVPGNLQIWDTYYWLDNERVVIGLYGDPYVLNPFTSDDYGLGKWYSQSPGGIKTIPVWNVNGIFDSQLSRIFYIQEDGTMLLWDLTQKQILTKFTPPGKFDPVGQPKWNRDDSKIFLAFTPFDSKNTGDEFFSITRNGQVTQLTQLWKHYSNVVISNFSLSPDGSRIAFYFSDVNDKDNSEQFAILDLQTHKVINYCNLSGFALTAAEPVWSPDGKMLLIENLEADSKTYNTILVDITKEFAGKLIENLIPVGWMNVHQSLPE